MGADDAFDQRRPGSGHADDEYRRRPRLGWATGGAAGNAEMSQSICRCAGCGRSRAPRAGRARRSARSLARTRRRRRRRRLARRGSRASANVAGDADLGAQRPRSSARRASRAYSSSAMRPPETWTSTLNAAPSQGIDRGRSPGIRERIVEPAGEHRQRGLGRQHVRALRVEPLGFVERARGLVVGERGEAEPPVGGEVRCVRATAASRNVR